MLSDRHALFDGLSRISFKSPYPHRLYAGVHGYIPLRDIVYAVYRRESKTIPRACGPLQLFSRIGAR